MNYYSYVLNLDRYIIW